MSTVANSQCGLVELLGFTVGVQRFDLTRALLGCRPSQPTRPGGAILHPSIFRVAIDQTASEPSEADAAVSAMASGSRRFGNLSLLGQTGWTAQ
jgi:hypothetical protein